MRALVFPLLIASCASAPGPVEREASAAPDATAPEVSGPYRGSAQEIGRQLDRDKRRVEREAAALDSRVRELGRHRVRFEQAMLYAALAAKLQTVERWQVELFSDE